MRLFSPFVFLLFLIAGTPVQAQQANGWGLAAGVGSSRIKDTDGGEKFDGGAFGYSLEAEYRFSRNLALGAGVFNLGSARDQFDGTDTEIKARGAGAFARLIYPASRHVDLYGRIGGVIYHAELEPLAINSLFGDDAVEYGIGADISKGGKLAFRIEGRTFDGPNAESGLLLTLGVSYRF